MLNEWNNEDEDGDIIIDAPYCDEYMTDINILLNVIKYWDVFYLTHSVIDTIRLLTNPIEEFPNTYHAEEAPFYSFYKELHFTHTQWLSSFAVKYNRVDILEYTKNTYWKWDENTCVDAVTYGAFECLQYLHQHGCPWNQIALNQAAKCGKLDCLKYLHDNHCKCGELLGYTEEEVCEYAAIGGHLHCLQFL
jgi:hypothetical protein